MICLTEAIVLDRIGLLNFLHACGGFMSYPCHELLLLVLAQVFAQYGEVDI